MKYEFSLLYPAFLESREKRKKRSSTEGAIGNDPYIDREGKPMPLETEKEFTPSSFKTKPPVSKRKGDF